MKNVSKHLVPNVGTLIILGLFFAMQVTGVFGAPNQPQVADVPTTIGYQGQLTDGSGNPVPDGSYTMRFRIYDDANNGTDLWTEYQDVAVTDGQFDVLLGNVTSLSGSLFDSSQRWLAVKVGSDPEMAPRQPLASVPFSLRADIADASITSAKIADGAVTQAKAPFAVAGPDPASQYRIEFHAGQASSGSITFYFDQPFTSPPEVFATPVYNGPVGKNISIANLTTTSVTFVNVDPPSITVRMMAVGH